MFSIVCSTKQYISSGIVFKRHKHIYILEMISGREWIGDNILVIIDISITKSWTENESNTYLSPILAVIVNYH